MDRGLLLLWTGVTTYTSKKKTLLSGIAYMQHFLCSKETIYIGKNVIQLHEDNDFFGGGNVSFATDKKKLQGPISLQGKRFPYQPLKSSKLKRKSLSG